MKKNAIVWDLDGTLCELKKYPDENRHTGKEGTLELLRLAQYLE